MRELISTPNSAEESNVNKGHSTCTTPAESSPILLSDSHDEMNKTSSEDVSFHRTGIPNHKDCGNKYRTWIRKNDCTWSG